MSNLPNFNIQFADTNISVVVSTKYMDKSKHQFKPTSKQLLLGENNRTGEKKTMKSKVTNMNYPQNNKHCKNSVQLIIY